jgi:hypothetical protein
MSHHDNLTLAELIGDLSGDPQEKRTLQILFDTVGGIRTDEDACEQLGVGQAELEEMRRGMLQSMLNAMADG